MKTNFILEWTTVVVILVLALTGCAEPAAEPAAPAPAEPAAEAPAEPAAPTPAEPATETQPAQIKLGLSLPGDNWYYNEVESGAQSAADDYGVELDITKDEFDPSIQAQQIETIVSSEVDAILVYTYAEIVAGSAYQAAISADIPWFALGWLPEGVPAQSLIKGDFQEPSVLGYAAVETAHDYLEGNPVPEVVDLPALLVLPDELQNGTIVPPPPWGIKWQYRNELESAMTESGISPYDYRLEAVVAYPGETAAEGLAAPVADGFDSFPTDGTPIMTFYDSQGYNEHGAIAYEVSFTDNGLATLYSPVNGVTITRTAYFADQMPVLGSTWALFVEGSCWLCGCCDGRCGCLICWP